MPSAMTEKTQNGDAEKCSKSSELQQDDAQKSLSEKLQDVWTAFFKMYLAWIRPHLNARDLKIAFRVAVAAWSGMLLLIIDRSRNYMGSAACEQDLLPLRKSAERNARPMHHHRLSQPACTCHRSTMRNHPGVLCIIGLCLGLGRFHDLGDMGGQK